MDIKEKAAQLIFPRLDIDLFNNDEEKKSQYIKMVEAGVGGFCLFGKNATITDIRTTIEFLQAKSKTPLLFCADMENGLRMRFNAGTFMPRPEAVGSINSTEICTLYAKMIANEARSCGILWNLAPVGDINSNPENPIIFLRAFGDTSELVSEMTSAFISGLESDGVMSCIKHFPGHGDTDTDSHISVPVINKNLKSLSENELIPFFSAIKQNVSSIMAGHLIVPALDDSNTPASISEKILTRFLKEKLNFEGLVITDALDMKSMTCEYSSDRLAYLALKAGADILLMPEEPFKSLDYIIANIDTQTSTLIETAYNKLLKTKEKLGLFTEFTYSAIKEEENELLSQFISRSALQIDGNSEFLPINEDQSYFLLNIIDSENTIDNSYALSQVINSSNTSEAHCVFIDNRFSDNDLESIQNEISESDFVIISYIQSPAAYVNKVKFSEDFLQRINKVSNSKKTILMLFGNISLSSVLKSDICIKTLSDSVSSFKAVSKILFPEDALKDKDVRFS